MTNLYKTKKLVIAPTAADTAATALWIDDLRLDDSLAADLQQLETDCRLLSMEANQLSAYEEARTEGVQIVQRLARAGLDTHALQAAYSYGFIKRGMLDKRQSLISLQAQELVASLASLAQVKASVSGVRLLAQQQRQVENIRSMVLVMSGDLRVALIRLAERATRLSMAVHAQSPECRRLGRQVLRIYVPIAERIGVHWLQQEMEELCLQALAPRQSTRLATIVRGVQSEWEGAAPEIIQTLQNELNNASISCRMESRIKNLYSIWRKMRRKGVGFDGLYDVLGLKVVVNTVPDCYAVLGQVHALWAHVADSLDDYIGNAKPSGYQSIHTAVVIPGVGILEVQVRTREMDREAEFGACAHWLYKKGGATNPWFDDRVCELRKLASQGVAPVDESDWATALLEDAMRSHIYVFTRDGDAVELPRGATVLDFAYQLHTDLGNRCVGGFINDIPVPAGRVLRNGQSVEIATDAAAEPQQEWLQAATGMLTTARARSAVRRWFRRDDEEQSRRRGEAQLLPALEQLGLPVTAMGVLAKKMGVQTVDHLLKDLGHGRLHLETVKEQAETLRVPSQRR